MSDIDDMPAGEELDRQKALKRAQSQRYIKSENGRATRRAYYEKTKSLHMERKRARRKRNAEENPEAVRARHLLGQAVRMGHIPGPPGGEKRVWGNRWEFHHPDHSRPYFGCWLRTPEHRLVDMGKAPCPPCVDYAEAVLASVLSSWGFTAPLAICRAALKAVS